MDSIQHHNNPLKSVEWNAVLEGPFLTYSCTQKYDNTSEETLEINYSFPLPYGKSVITKFSAVINGIKKEAKAFPKTQAEEHYEEAIESGDSPVMLEITEKDFCTASIGNLKPGEKAEIIVEYLQLVKFSGNRARIKIPTVLDDRYASDPEELPSGRYEIETNLMADYPCKGHLLIKGKLAGGKVSSPTHDFSVQMLEDGMELEVKGAKLNSDFVFDIEATLEEAVYVSKDGNQFVALANLTPQLKTCDEKPLDLIVLLDCSGSMIGNRIEAAKKALLNFTSELKHEDQVGLVVFGSDYEVVKAPSGLEKEHPNLLNPNSLLTKKKNQNFTWEELLAGVDADLGGTEMALALNGVAEIFPAENSCSSILLITDGEVCDKEEILKAAKKTGRRIFTLGIGVAPYENLLTEISLETGGAYDSVYGYWDIEGAVERTTARLRSPITRSPSIQWKPTPSWTSDLPRQIFSSDSIVQCAFIDSHVGDLKVSWCNDQTQILSPTPVTGEFGRKFVQFVVNQKMLGSKDRKEQEALGVKYNLAGPATNFLLIHERAEEDKAGDNPVLRMVPQMVAADRLSSASSFDVVYCCSKSAPRKSIRKASRKSFWPIDSRFKCSLAKRPNPSDTTGSLRPLKGHEKIEYSEEEIYSDQVECLFDEEFDNGPVSEKLKEFFNLFKDLTTEQLEKELKKYDSELFKAIQKVAEELGRSLPELLEKLRGIYK